MNRTEQSQMKADAVQRRVGVSHGDIHIEAVENVVVQTEPPAIHRKSGIHSTPILVEYRADGGERGLLGHQEGIRRHRFNDASEAIDGGRQQRVRISSI